jgi:hypothetical protein
VELIETPAGTKLGFAPLRRSFEKVLESIFLRQKKE